MLDDMATLREAAAGYREAATALGVTWPDPPDSNGGQPSDLVHRMFGVDRIAEQLIWFQSQGWHSRRLLPNGGYVRPWPAHPKEAFRGLSVSVATPFPWRHQLPLFDFDVVLFTFVLAGDHEGEIWRHEVMSDEFDSVRAATSLATLLTEWTKGIAAGAVFCRESDQWLIVHDYMSDAFDLPQEIAPDLDPFAFPESISNESILRARQVECGVDLERLDRGAEYQVELLDDIAATRRSLGV